VSSPSRSDGFEAPVSAALVVLLLAVHLASGAWYAAQADLGWADALLWARGPRFRVLVGGQHAALVAHGQWWRLCTSVLLHVDALHLAVNALSVAALGRWLEPMIGGARLAAWFAVGGLAGSVASQLGGVARSDGASGAAYALLGGLLVLAWRRRDDLSGEERRLLGPVLLGVLAMNLAISAVLPFIDLVGHLGGLGAGLALGVIARKQRDVALNSAIFVLFLGVCAWGWLGGR
jgi:rhomboid protease GluP